MKNSSKNHLLLNYQSIKFFCHFPFESAKCYSLYFFIRKSAGHLVTKMIAKKNSPDFEVKKKTKSHKVSAF